MTDETHATGIKKAVAILLMVLGIIAMIATGTCTIFFAVGGIQEAFLIGVVPFLLGLLLYFWGNWLRRRP